MDKSILKFIPIIFLVALIFLTTQKLEIETIDLCINSEQLNKLAEFNLTRDGTVTEHVVNQTLACPYGCDSVYNVCFPPPLNVWLFILVVFIFMIALIGFMWKRFA